MPKLTRTQAQEVIQTILDHAIVGESMPNEITFDDWEQTIADVQEAAGEPTPQPTDEWKHDDPPSFDRLAKPTMRKVKP